MKKTGFLVLVLALAIPITALALTRQTGFFNKAADSVSTYTIPPAADTYVDDNYESKNYGSSTQLKTDGSPERISFLKFRIPSFSGAITSAKLRITYAGDTHEDKKVYSVGSSSWSETEMTYVNKPALLSVIGRIPAGDVGQVKSVDITDFVKGKAGQTISIAIFSETSNGVIYNSKEASLGRPALIIQETSSVATPVPTAIQTPVPTQTPIPTAIATLTPKPTVTITPLPTATPKPTITPIPTPTTSPAPQPVGSGIWISPQEIMTKPMSGEMWSIIKKIADSSLGTANLADQNNRHSIKTYAVALVAIRTGQDSYRAKAVNEIVKAIGTENNPDADGSCVLGPRGGADTLAMGRNVMAYAVAADVLNLRPGGYDPDGKGTQIYNWLKRIQTRENCMPHGGQVSTQTLAETHEESASNGNALNGGSRVAVSAYLRDRADLDRAWLTYRRYTGDPTMPIDFRSTVYAKSWSVILDRPIGINPKGATKNYNGQTYSVDGVVVNDQGRGGDFKMPPGYTSYPWDGLQGAFGQAVILDRLGYKDSAGNDAWRVNDSALLRAVEYQWMLQQRYGGSWFDSKRAAWVKHLANVMYGRSYPAANRFDSRNIDFTQWTHR